MGPAPPMWYHRDLSRAAAEELLARAGRDGSFLVRDSESVNGAYALCVLFQKHVHTYRILPDEEGFLAVQTSQGVQPKRFKTLPELVSLYLQPSQGLVTTLLYTVDREETAISDERDYSGTLGPTPFSLSVNQGGDQELENLVTKLAILKDLLSSIEKKVREFLIIGVAINLMVQFICAHLHCHRVGSCFIFDFCLLQKREAFCQLLQLMKNKHSNQDEPDMISIFIGTWNMGSVPAPKCTASWVLCRGLGKTLDEMTVTIPMTCMSLGSKQNWITNHVGMSSVKTGIANTLGNKGAVGVSFMFNGTSFGFVNCHLTSGNEKIARRNQNYLDILRQLSLGDKQLSSFDISLRFTHLFWLGDLNYRLDMDIQEILNYINRKEFEPLLKVDQLNLEREKNKVFLRFAEEEISFPPTYRYERGSRDTYVWQKQKATGMRINVPSWCDRILWKSYPETHIVCNSYGCTDDIVTSDHSPVFATFEVGLPKSSEQAYIEFESIEAIVKTASRTKFFIEFYSTCLEEFKKSYENDSQSSDNVNFLRVGWSNKQLTTLKPLLSEVEYLQDQHLLLTVKSLDGYESYGECVLALKSMIGSTPQQFHTYLSHRGEETGNIRGLMRVRVPSERMGTRERLYEWISVDKDETGGPKGKSTIHPRIGHDYVNYNNPAYYILEGVPNQSAASAELHTSPTSANAPATKPAPLSSGARAKPPCGAPGPSHSRVLLTGHPAARAITEEGPSEDDACVVYIKMYVYYLLVPIWTTLLQYYHFNIHPEGPFVLFSFSALQALWGSSSSSLSVGESSVGEWLQRLGLEQYEQGLLHNGWDDLEFLSDITEEDLEEAGVLDPAHKRLLLESLRQQ
uniref:phosphatidylinositol-3,4,5-trisphosphate 5-phosphatase n=1 Tax=Neogobius melanostomus TaxID=47308 RepID=A0A8C6U7A7_9GOBI